MIELSGIDKKEKDVLRLVFSSTTPKLLHYPPKAFFELYGRFNIHVKDIIIEWNVLLHFKNNTAKNIEKEVIIFNEFCKDICGMSMDERTISEVHYHCDRINKIGIEIHPIL